jgi:hypothetical protein
MISGVSFGTNMLMLSALNSSVEWGAFPRMLVAACIAGFVATFLVLPVGE